MFTNIRYILLTALRDWLFAVLMIGVLGCALLSHILGSTALIETQEMTLSFTSASARVVIITGLILFTCFHIRNAFDTKEMDVFLSRPITRSNLVFSYWLGFAAVSVLLVIPPLLLIALEGIMSHSGFLFWALSLLLECWLVVTVALFFSFVLRSAVTSVIASMGFYVLARLMGFFIDTSKNVSVFDTQQLNDAVSGILRLLSVIMPRLDFFAKSDWLIYGLKNPNALEIFALYAVILIPLLVLATIIDFSRRQF